MAEETFNPDDMPKTERYQIPYPGADNLVRFAAYQFGAMATAIDEKLGDVDDRQTDAARATIVRNTLTELQQTSPATGQFGYVTDDGDNTGIWCWNGGSWSKVSGATPMTVVKPTLAELQTVTDLSDGVFGLVSDDPVASNNGVYVFNNNAWAPITGTSGGTLAASTLSQLQATSAPTGTLAYVSNDPDADNNLVYVRTAASAWTPVGGSQAKVITSGFSASIVGETPSKNGLWGTVNGNVATLQGGLSYSSKISGISSSTKVASITVPSDMRPKSTKNIFIPATLNVEASKISSSSNYLLMQMHMALPCSIATNGAITFPSISDLSQWILTGDEQIYSVRSVLSVVVNVAGVSWPINA